MCMIRTMIGVDTTPLITALQNSALIGSMKLSEVQRGADHRGRGDRAIEGAGAIEFARQTDMPAERLAQARKRPSRPAPASQQARADDAQSENHGGQRARRSACSALAASAEVWMSVMPWAFSVAAVVQRMNMAITAEKPMPM